MQSSCSSLCKKCSTSTAHFFTAAANNRFWVLSFLGLAKSFWDLAKDFWAVGFPVHSKGLCHSHLSLIVQTKTHIEHLVQVTCLALQV